MKTAKLCVTGLCEGNSPGTGEFRVQMASNAENVSIWWRHHDATDIIPRLGVKTKGFGPWYPKLWIPRALICILDTTP